METLEIGSRITPSQSVSDEVTTLNDQKRTKNRPIYSSAYINYVIFLLMLVNVVNYMDRTALSALLPLIKTDLALTDTELGLLTGVAFAIFYGLFGIPIARLADKSNRRNIIAVAMTFWSAATALCGAASGFWQLFIARISVGVGEAGCIAPAQSMISDYVPVERRAGALSLHSIGVMLGIVAGLALGGWLGELIGWRVTFIVLGIPGVILAIILKFTLHEPPRGYADGNTVIEETMPLTEVGNFLWHCRSYVHLCIAMIIGNFVMGGLMVWLPSFYVRSFDLGVADVGFYYGLAHGIGGVVGLLLGGVLANHLIKRDERFPVWLGAGAYFITGPIYYYVFAASSYWLSFVSIFFATVIYSLSNGPMLVVLQSVVKPRMRAIASAIVILFSSLIGFAGGPLFVGMTSDYFSTLYGDESLRYSLMAILALLPWGALHVYLASQSVAKDFILAGVRIKKAVNT